MLAVGLFILGLLLVVKGGDMFVDSAVKISRATGLPEIFIGATIVSIATTLPEGIVSATAAMNGYTTMSIGNAIGSIICNTGLILGIVNVISPSMVKGRMFTAKSLTLVAYMGIMTLLILDRSVSHKDSIILLLMLLAYLVFDTFILKYKQNKSLNKQRITFDMYEKGKIAFGFIIGIGGIILGANLLINNGIIIAKLLGVPESIISLTMIALGTSLPELVAAITALLKGYSGLSIGNILGANILNIAMVLGISSTINELKILKQNIYFDVPVIFILLAILVIPTLKVKKVTRIQGVFMLIIYGAYLFLLYNVYI